MSVGEAANVRELYEALVVGHCGGGRCRSLERARRRHRSQTSLTRDGVTQTRIRPGKQKNFSRHLLTLNAHRLIESQTEQHHNR